VADIDVMFPFLRGACDKSVKVPKLNHARLCKTGRKRRPAAWPSQDRSTQYTVTLCAIMSTNETHCIDYSIQHTSHEKIVILPSAEGL